MHQAKQLHVPHELAFLSPAMLTSVHCINYHFFHILLASVHRKVVNAFKLTTKLNMGTAVAQWLRCYATNRKVAGSIPAGVINIKSFRSHYGPGVDSASNRNEYQ